MAQALLWNARQPAPLRLAALDPQFIEYVTRALNFTPPTTLYGLLLSLHRCRRLTLYGLALSKPQGNPIETLNPGGTL